MTVADERTEKEIAASLVGRTIVAADWPDDVDHWGDAGVCVLRLDDGRIIEFGAWGHDAWGPTIGDVETIDVAECLHCAQPHPFARVSSGFHERNHYGLPTVTFAYCSDGNHAAWVSA